MSSCMQADDHLAVRLDLLGAVVTSTTQLNACCGGVMSSPMEANRMMGDLIVAQVEGVAARGLDAPCHSLLPMKRLLTIHSISSVFIR